MGFDLEQIVAALYAGQKIEAIKIYREVTQEGLLEAKNAVEAIEARLREETPGRFKTPTGTGCAGVVMLVVGSAVCLMGLFFIF